MYRREWHNHIALVLRALNSELMSSHSTYFGGGTAMAMQNGEYRTSFDIDFLASNLEAYRDLRAMVKKDGIGCLFTEGLSEIIGSTKPIIDQYGIRSRLKLAGEELKFEIVFEGRVELDDSGHTNSLESILCLTETDLVAEKVMANSDRFLDRDTFNRDIIDLAFAGIGDVTSHAGFVKATHAYGDSAKQDLERAIDLLVTNHDWLDRCIDSLQIDAPRAVVMRNLRSLIPKQ